MSAAAGGGGLAARVATGLVLAAAALGLVMLAPVWLLAAIIAAGAAGAMREYSRMALPGLPPILGMALAAALPVLTLFGPVAAFAGAGAGLTLCAVAALAEGGGPEQVQRRALRLGWGMAYCGGLFACLALLPTLSAGRLLLLYLLLSVCAADTGAYIAGRLLGRTPLAPAISPKKTIEGLVGGLFLAGAAGAIFCGALLPALGPLWGALLSLLLAALSVAGDLMESAIKRAAGVKDSGSIFPGHGGVLDRLDGIMVAAPAMLLIGVLLWR